MEKLSIYELFSYLFPGLLIVELTKYTFFHYDLLNQMELSLNVIGLLTGFIAGISLHAFIDTFKIYNWFEKLYFNHPSEIYKNDTYLTDKMKTFLCEYYNKTSNKSELEYKDGYPLNLFDHAYMYLESIDKAGPVKNLHSLYYLLRNSSFVLLVFIIIMIFFRINQKMLLNENIVFFSLLFGFLFCILGAKFLRSKYVSKAIRLYYSLHVHKLHEPKSES